MILKQYDWQGYMRLLSAVSIPNKTPTNDNPIVSDGIDIILPDEQKVTLKGPKPKICFINSSFIPYVAGNGVFTINGGNKNFSIGRNALETFDCVIPLPTAPKVSYSLPELTDAIVAGINNVDSRGNAALNNWAAGLDVNCTIANGQVQLITTACTLHAPEFDDPNCFDRVGGDEFTVIGVDSINNAGLDTALLYQNYANGSFPRCTGTISGLVQGDGHTLNGDGFTVTSFSVSIAAQQDGGYIELQVYDGQWLLNLVNETTEIGPYNSGDTFTLRMAGRYIGLAINDIDVGDFEIPTQYITYRAAPTGLTTIFEVAGGHQVSAVEMTTLPNLSSIYYGAMTNPTTSYIDWTTEALEVMIGSSARTLTGTAAGPSVISCVNDPVANTGLGNILVCVDMDIGGHISGPVSGAKHNFIYTISKTNGNLQPVEVVAPVLLPIDLGIYGFKSISRIKVTYVVQATNQLVGFASPVSITLGFIDE